MAVSTAIKCLTVQEGIAIHTNDPGDKFELELTGMYESVADETTVQGIISGFLSDNFGLRLAFNVSEADDNWIDVVNFDRFETGKYGLVTMCAAGGMAPAIVIERV